MAALHPRATLALGTSLVVGAAAAAVILPVPDTTNPLIPDSANRASLVAPFVAAQAGDCVTWTRADGGAISDFRAVGCAEPHRVEVTRVVNLDTVPGAEFGPTAALPSLERQRGLKEQFCVIAADQYLSSGYDPAGKFDVSPILPPATAWAEGDRTMLCGLQVPDDTGGMVETTGSARDADQSRIVPTGSCLAVREGQVSRDPVDCAEDHILEITAEVDLSGRFPDSVPDAAAQDTYLDEVCTQAARDYLGGDDPLYFSTLIPFWTTLPLSSWLAGTRKVNCALVFPHPEGGFSTLKGSAKGEFTIDGHPKDTLPPRRPLRETPGN